MNHEQPLPTPGVRTFYRKGKIIETIIPWRVFPLFLTEEAEGEDDRFRRLLPRYMTVTSVSNTNVSCSTAADDDGDHMPGNKYNSVDQGNNDERKRMLLPTEQHKYVQRLLNPTTTKASDNSLIRNVLQEDLYAIYAIVIAFHCYSMIAWEDTSNNVCHIASQINNTQNSEIDEHEDDLDSLLDWSLCCRKLIDQSWRNLFDQEYSNSNTSTDGKISSETWKLLVRKIYRQMYIVPMEHPLINYATHIIPLLDQNELQTVIQILQLPVIIPDKNSQEIISSLAVMKHVQDIYQDKQRMYGVLLDDSLLSNNKQKNRYTHSCIPTSKLCFTANDSNHSCDPLLHQTRELLVTSLYDNTVIKITGQSNDDDESRGSLCLISEENIDDCVEIREASVLRRTGKCCGCLRCRWESIVAAGDDESQTIPEQKQMATLKSTNDATALGHYYLRCGKYQMAQCLYEYALNHTPPNALDLWHALGAIALSQNQFLKAQRIWKQGSDQCPEDYLSHHAGMQLQLEKINSYLYLLPEKIMLARHQQQQQSKSSAMKLDDIIKFQSIVMNAFIADRVVDFGMCQRVIDMAEAGGRWTQKRHYAVPTYDIPIHTVPPLLEWFLHGFWIPIMRPLLAQQFQTTRNYFVHDAFCVRYEAGKHSNHLPIHTDESTHSFIVALNDDYEGGGTYFFDSNQTVHLKAGQVLSFRGDTLQHGGDAVTRGVRYILAVFLYHDDDDSDGSFDGDNNIDIKGKKNSDCGNSENNMTGHKRSMSQTTCNNNNSVKKLFHREVQQQKTSNFSFGFHIDDTMK